MLKTEWEKIVVKNYKSKLRQIFCEGDEKIERLTLSILESKPFDPECLMWYLNAVSMLSEPIKLISVLDKIKKQSIKFKFNKEFFYYLAKNDQSEKNLELIITFCKEYLHQDLKEENIGEFNLNEGNNDTTFLRLIYSQNEVKVKMGLEELGISALGHQYLIDGTKRFPIFVASAMANEKIVQILIKNGADVNSVSLQGDSPLIRACQNRQLKTMRVLIENGSDVNFKGYYGNAPIHVVVTDEVYHDDDETLSLQALQIILEANADIRVENSRGVTPFVRACGTNNLKMIKIFLNLLIEKYDNTQYLQDELLRGVESAIQFLRDENVEYLLEFIESKAQMKLKIEHILNIDSSGNHKIFMKLNFLKLVQRQLKLFCHFIAFDLIPDGQEPLYFIKKFMLLCDPKFFEMVNSSLELSQEFIDLILTHIQILIHFGKLKCYQVDWDEIFDSFRRNFVIKRNFFAAVENLSHFSLKSLCVNAIRGSMISLSSKHIRQLGLPIKLQLLLR